MITYQIEAIKICHFGIYILKLLRHFDMSAIKLTNTQNKNCR